MTMNLHHFGPGRRSGDVLLSRMDSRYENPVMLLLNPNGFVRHQWAIFDPDDRARRPEDEGIPSHRLLPEDATECGLRESLPADLAMSDGRRIRHPALIPESKAEPQIPGDTLPLRVRSEVVFWGWLDKTGAVRALAPIRASPGFPSFAEAAIDAICRWRYEPARRDEDGAPIDTRFTVYVEFQGLP
jgi:hypothetical protein